MTAILLVCLPSVALGREAADAVLGPAASKSYLLLVWSPLPCIRDTASVPAKQALSHLFWPTGVNLASHEASCPSSEIMVIFNQKVVQKIKAPPPCKLTQNIWINFQVSWLFYHLIHTHRARNCNSIAINLPPETVLARQSPHTTQVVLQTAALFLKQNMDVFSSPLPNKYMKCATWQVACRWQNSQNSAEIQDGVARRIPTTLCQKKKKPQTVLIGAPPKALSYLCSPEARTSTIVVISNSAGWRITAFHTKGASWDWDVNLTKHLLMCLP